MNPEGDKILGLAAQRLAMEIAPMLGNAFAQGQIGLLGFMLTLVANEYERGADLRAAENRAIRTLFADATPFVRDPALREKLATESQAHDASLRISALNAENWKLRRLLIELQTHIELLEGESARNAERRIWTLLRSIAEQRMVRLGPG